MAATLDIVRSSASPPAAGIRTQPTVTKLVDTSTCIGCKACEVACQEWNDLPPETTVQMGTYQTLPDMTSNFWNLIRFSEHESESGFSSCRTAGALARSTISGPTPGMVWTLARIRPRFSTPISRSHRSTS